MAQANVHIEGRASSNVFSNVSSLSSKTHRSIRVHITVLMRFQLSLSTLKCSKHDGIALCDIS